MTISDQISMINTDVLSSVTGGDKPACPSPQELQRAQDLLGAGQDGAQEAGKIFARNARCLGIPIDRD
jgi:hypothetical protein